jgi:hypothetical protein
MDCETISEPQIERRRGFMYARFTRSIETTLAQGKAVSRWFQGWAFAHGGKPLEGLGGLARHTRIPVRRE